MRHRVAMRKLGRPTGHRLSLIRNLMTDLIRHERLQTTEPKAAELRREVEKLIGTARANDLHARRLHPRGQAGAAPRRRRADGPGRAPPLTCPAPFQLFPDACA